MRPELMDILACPVCKGTLTLNVVEEEDGDIIKGALHCPDCDHSYLIDDGIPDLLPPE